MSGVTVSPATVSDLGSWAAMRHALWPDGSEAEHLQEIETYPTDAAICLIAHGPDRAACGFAEISLRHDYVNGCETSPVAFLEGIYVAPDARREGVARALIEAAETWAAAQGCTEFASDAAIDNTQSAAMHGALGFEETQRVIYFRKVLTKA
jgi:aminoglycoside 6'-N-acetyltransferase I